MELIQQLLIKTYHYTKESFFWWLLALIQFFCLSLLAIFTKALYIKDFLFSGWFLLGILLLSLSSLWLWLSVQAKEQKEADLAVKPKEFISLFIRLSLINLAGYLCIFAFRLIFVYWGTFTLFSSVLIASWIAVALFVVLFKEKISNGLKLAIDLWSKFSILPALAALSLMAAHGVSFSAARLFGAKPVFRLGFSGSPNFGTMFVLLIILFAIAAVTAAAINVFLVLGFMELIKKYGNKQGARRKETAGEPAMEASS